MVKQTLKLEKRLDIMYFYGSNKALYFSLSALLNFNNKKPSFYVEIMG